MGIPKYVKVISVTIAFATQAWTGGLAVHGLVPVPDSFEARAGVLAIPDAARIFAADSQAAPLAALLSNDLFALRGKRYAPVRGSGATAGDILFKLDAALGAEEYVLDIGDRVEIRSGGVSGLGYGAVTFLQSAGPGPGALDVGKARILDRPESQYRGLLVDIARKAHTPGGLKFMIDYCRLYKVNQLQLHLTDDQAITFPFTSVTGLGASNTGGIKAFTKAEWKELEDYAALRGVSIVPEIEMPGHGGTLVRARPDLFKTGSAHPSTLNIANPKAVEALKAMVTEACQTFRHTPRFHIGADEVDLASLDRGKGGIGVDPAVRLQWDAYMDSLTLVLRKAGRLGADQQVESAGEVYKDFVNRMGAHVKSLGKRPMMWEGFDPGGGGVVVDTAFTVMPFDIFFNPARYMDAGYRLINASWTPLYIYNPSNDIAAGIHPSADTIYAWDKMAFDIVPRRRTPTSRIVVPEKYAPDILGGHLCIWDTPQSLDTAYIRRRLPAMAEKLWNRKAGSSYQDFQARLPAAESLMGGLVAAGRLPFPEVAPTGVRRIARPSGQARAAKTSGRERVRMDGKLLMAPRAAFR